MARWRKTIIMHAIIVIACVLILALTLWWFSEPPTGDRPAPERSPRNVVRVQIESLRDNGPDDAGAV